MQNYLFAVLCLFFFVQCESVSENTIDNSPETVKLLKTYEKSGESNYKIELFYNEDQTLDYAISTSNEFEDFIREYIYESGLLIRSEKRDINAVYDDYFEEYIYENGVLVTRKDIYNENFLDETFQFTILNNRIQDIAYYAQDDPDLRSIYVYNYDASGNVVLQETVVDSNTESEIQYTYDDKINPFRHVKPHFLLWEDFPSRVNNVLSSKRINLSDNRVIWEENYTYTYDSDGYPITQEDGVSIITFTYY